MAFFSRFISNILSRKEKGKIDVHFGKYIEPFNKPDYHTFWNKAVELYQNGSYLEAYKTLFDFLLNPKQQNFKYSASSHKLDFEFYQGSKKINGTITETTISAIADIVEYQDFLPNTLIEQLLQENHKLRYCRFVKTSRTIAIRYDAPVKITSPEDLYNALRELAIYADSYDDVLVDRFSFLKPINIQHIIPLSDKEIRIKIEFMRQWIKQTLSIVEKLSKDKTLKDQNRGLISYLLLDLIYKIYYLIAPEGVLLDFLRQLDKTYWQGRENILQKNDYLFTSFQLLYTKDSEYFRKSLYRVKSTFSVVQQVKKSKIFDFVSSELEGINWLKSQNPQLYLRLCEYIIGYLNFHIALPPSQKDLLDILWRVLNDDYFLALGYSINFVSRTKLNSFAIEYQINRVLNRYQIKGFRSARLDYSSIADFTKNFLSEYLNLLRNEY